MSASKKTHGQALNRQALNRQESNDDMLRSADKVPGVAEAMAIYGAVHPFARQVVAPAPKLRNSTGANH